ncbi:MAG: ABC transporter permease [Phycisphaerales bacterium]
MITRATAMNSTPANPTSSGGSTTHAPLGLHVAGVLWRREMVRFARQPARIAAAIGTPIIVWALMGSGFAEAYRPAIEVGGESGAVTTSYGSFLLPGMMTLVALFTAIFSCISIIEDRQEGWLQSVLVSPAPRWSIAAGKILGGSTLAFVQAALLLAVWPWLGAWPGAGPLMLVLAALLLVSVGMTGVGVAFAWRSASTQGFHAVMNLVLMPMWLLSGAFFPPQSAAPWLEAVMWINPLTWGTIAVRHALLGGDFEVWPLAGSALFAGLAFGMATAVVAHRGKGILA